MTDDEREAYVVKITDRGHNAYAAEKFVQAYADFRSASITLRKAGEHDRASYYRTMAEKMAKFAGMSPLL